MPRPSQLLVLLCLLPTILLVVSGCQGLRLVYSTPTTTPAAAPTRATVAAAPTPAPTATIVPQQRTIRLAAGPNNSEVFKLGQAIANAWTKRVPGLKVEVIASEGQGPNLRLLDAGQADVIIVRDDIAQIAANKLPPFGDRAIQTAALGAIAWDVVQILVAEDTGITSSRQISGRNVSWPHYDSAATVMINQVLGPGKFTYDDFPSVLQVPDDQAAVAFQERKVDVVMTAGPVPIPALQQAAQARPVRVIEINDSWRDLVIRQYPALTPITIPAGTYQGQNEDAQAVGARTILGASLRMEADLASSLAQALADGSGEIAANSSLAAGLKPEELTTGVRTPFHTGAIDGYIRRGLIK